MILKVLESDDKKFGVKALTNYMKIRTEGLADLGAQMVLIGSNVLNKLGVRKSELLKVETKLSVGNGEELLCLDGILLSLLIPD